MKRLSRGSGIQACRIRAGYRTAHAAADAMGVKRGTYVNWEQGRTFPRFDEVLMLAGAFGCSVDELYGRHASAASAGEPSDAEVARDGRLRYVVSRWGSLDDAQRDVVRALVACLAGELPAQGVRRVRAAVDAVLRSALRGAE